MVPSSYTTQASLNWSFLIFGLLAERDTKYGVRTDTAPANTILHPDSDGAPRQETWNYCSVIGKLNFITGNTQPDIAFAVHQCAKYSNNLHAIHEVLGIVKCKQTSATIVGCLFICLF